MFSEELEKIDWEKITKAIYSKTEHDVLRALGKEHCDVDDFMALISPAAAKSPICHCIHACMPL